MAMELCWYVCVSFISAICLYAKILYIIMREVYASLPLFLLTCFYIAINPVEYICPLNLIFCYEGVL